MVLSGAKDPLNDAGGRARQLQSCCPEIEVVLVEAGHCPHDEQPGIINTELMRFLACIKVSSQSTIQQQTGSTVRAASLH